MRGSLLAFAATLLVLSISPASAQLVGTDTAPGESCAGVATGASRMTADADQDGAQITLICDGSVWTVPNTPAASPDRSVQFNSGGFLYGESGLTFTTDGLLDLVGEIKIGSQALACSAPLEGALRYTSASDLWEFCNGSAWGALATGGSGLWSDSGAGYIEYSSVLGGMRVGDVSGQPAPNIIGVTNLSDLGDVNAPSPSDQQVLKYDSSTGKWIPGADGGASSLNDLSDAATAYGSGNLYIGQGAGAASPTGSGNTFLGLDAGLSTSIGSYNTFLGKDAGSANTTGSRNTFVGINAGTLDQTGGDNTIVGHNAGDANNGGNWNVFLGSNAGGANTSGHKNIFLGYRAGESNLNGDNNIIIGDNIDAPTTSTSNYLNIGDTIYGDLSNGGGNGNVGIGTTAPAIRLDVAGALKIAYDAQSCAAASEGAIRYDSSTDAFEVCATAGSWSALGGGGGTPAGANTQIQFNNSGAFGASANLVYDGIGLVGTYTGTGNGQAALKGLATGATGTHYGVRGEVDSATTGAAGVYGLTNAATGVVYGVKGVTTSVGGSGVRGDANVATGSSTGVYGRTDSTGGTGVFGLASTGTGATFAVSGQNNSTSGTGVRGWANATTGWTYGVYGRTDSTDGIGTFGTATTGTGATFGVFGQNASTAGTGVKGYTTTTTGSTYGVLGQSASTSGTGVRGYVTATTGWTYGVNGESASTDGIGVFGHASTGTGGTFGVYGRSDSSAGYGVFCKTVAGGACGGDKAWTNTSDARLKESIAELSDERGLDSIMRLRPVTYHWKGKGGTENQEIGLIAQEVLDIYPELVRTNGPEQDIEYENGTSETVTDTMSLSYAEFVVPLIKAVQEQQAQIEALKAANDNLAAANGNYATQIEALRKDIDAVRNQTRNQEK